jgi:hypothetical protein
MRMGTGLTVVAIGAILAFAVTSSPSFFNIQIAGWVIMLTGVVSMVLSRRPDYSQLLRRLRPRARVVQRNTETRALGPGQVFQLPPDPGSPPGEARPSAAEATADSTIQGPVEHAEKTAEEHSEE